MQTENFFSQFKLIRYLQGEVLFSAQDFPPGIFYLKKGFVRQYAISDEGRELTIHIYGPSSHFPMMWALNGIPNRHYFQALTDIEVFLAPKEEVKQFLSRNPQVVFEFTKRLLFGLDGLIRRIESSYFGRAYDRVISILLYLSSHFGEKKGKRVFISHKFTHNDIASMVGITREHVSLEMEKLQNKGLIKYKNRAILIPDLSLLEKELG